MDLEKLEQDIRALVDERNKAEFIYGLPIAYGLPRSSITRLKKGDLNKSKDGAQIVRRKKLCFRHETDGELLSAIGDPKWICTSDKIQAEGNSRLRATPRIWACGKGFGARKDKELAASVQKFSAMYL